MSSNVATIGILRERDSDSVFNLYRESFERSKLGFLTEKSYEQILLAISSGLSVGAFVDGRLVAYSLSVNLSELYAPEALKKKCSIYVGQGSVVSRAFEGRLLMVKILKYRLKVMEEGGNFCSIGLVDVNNYGSIVSIFISGFKLGGVRRDSQSMNYIAYFHNLENFKFSVNDYIYREMDHASLLHYFRNGMVGVTIRKRSDGREMGLVPASSIDNMCGSVEW